MTLRTSFIGHEDRLPPRGLMQWVLNHRQGAAIEGYTNCWWNGMTCYQLIKCVDTIIKEDLYDNGLYHIHTPARSSKEEICSMINDVYGLQIHVEPVQATDIMGTQIKKGGHINRTLGSIYDLSKSLNIQSIREQIVEQKEWHESQL